MIGKGYCVQADLEKKLQAEILGREPGNSILTCIQCGTCSGSCPLADAMDAGPRALFALIRDGQVEQALRSNTSWYCVSCYQCMVQCPQQIPITDIMYLLKQLSLEQGLVPRDNKMPDLYAAFERQVNLFGKVSEALLMADYGIKHPLDVMANAAAAVKLLARGRLHLVPRKIEAPRRLQAMIDAAGQKEHAR